MRRSQSQVSSMGQASLVETIDSQGIIYFTRSLMLKRLMTEAELFEIYKDIFNRDPESSRSKFNKIFDNVKKNLQRSNIRIVVNVCEFSNEKYYSIIPTNNLRQSQSWPNLMFKPEELTLMKSIMMEILNSAIGLVTRERVLRINENLTRDDAGKVIDKLVGEKYLIEPTTGKYTFSVLATSELGQYFPLVFGVDLKRCVFCKRTMYFGGQCQHCESNGHFWCVSKFRESMDHKPIKCPTCREVWPLKNMEDIMMDVEDEYDTDIKTEGDD